MIRGAKYLVDVVAATFILAASKAVLDATDHWFAGCLFLPTFFAWAVLVVGPFMLLVEMFLHALMLRMNVKMTLAFLTVLLFAIIGAMAGALSFSRALSPAIEERLALYANAS